MRENEIRPAGAHSARGLPNPAPRPGPGRRIRSKRAGISYA
jgi:hypothetical protein